MKEIIEHQGVIESIEDAHVRVNIVQMAACSGCKARSLCTSSESKEKIIDVYEVGAKNKYKVDCILGSWDSQVFGIVGLAQRLI